MSVNTPGNLWSQSWWRKRRRRGGKEEEEECYNGRICRKWRFKSWNERCLRCGQISGGQLTNGVRSAYGRSVTHSHYCIVSCYNVSLERLLGFSAVGPAGLSPMNCYTVLPCFHLWTGTVRYARPIIYMYAYIVSQKFVHSWGFLKNFPPTAESFKLKF